MDIAQHNRKLVHYGKYVFALSTLLPFRRGNKKPTETLSTAELLARYPERVKMLWRESAGIQQGNHPTSPLETVNANQADEGFVMEIAGGWCHGRHCDWIGLDDVVLSEPREKEGRFAPKPIPGGRLNPRYYRRLLTTPRRLPRPIHVDGTVMVLNKSGSHNYFHWLCEVLPRLELARQAGVAQADAYLVDCHKPFQRQALELLGVPLEKVIQPHEGLLVQAERLIVPSYATAASRRCLSETVLMRSGVQSDSKSGAGVRRIYVSRRHARKRSLGNEAEVAALLAAHGFEILCLEQFHLADQIRKFSDAAIVVGLHGAGLTNILWCRSAVQLIEIIPQNYARDYFELLASELAIPYQQVVATRKIRRSTFQCPLESLETVASNAIAAIET
ncbi:glycosyltransferase family 61 protein [Rosistilla oblonga]|uniref:glycosyltransferase family 61 protein n=1 Tax=Rosistilla oblonga TaxID=2527990 RepID=UPI003A975D08